MEQTNHKINYEVFQFCCCNGFPDHNTQAWYCTTLNYKVCTQVQQKVKTEQTEVSMKTNGVINLAKPQLVASSFQ